MVRQGRALCGGGRVYILKLKFHLVTAAKTVKFKYAEGSPKTFPKTKSGGGVVAGGRGSGGGRWHGGTGSHIYKLNDIIIKVMELRRCSVN